jgi:hypothetical protein
MTNLAMDMGLLDNFSPLYTLKVMTLADFKEYEGKNLGEIIVISDTDPMEQYVWTGDRYDHIGPISDNETSYEEEIEEIVRTECPHCGASLNLDKMRKDGTCRCEFCRSFVKVKNITKTRRTTW